MLKTQCSNGRWSSSEKSRKRYLEEAKTQEHVNMVSVYVQYVVINRLVVTITVSC